MNFSHDTVVLDFQLGLLTPICLRWHCTQDQFLEIEAQLHLLEWIKDNYDYLHLIGTEGVLDEIEDYIRSCGGCNYVK